MKITVKDILSLAGEELKDNSRTSERYRNFISQDKWETDDYKDWLDECIREGKGAHDPYNRAFQDLCVILGKKLGFKTMFGKYQAQKGEVAYDGMWERESGEVVVLEIKTSTWPIASIDQLGKYVEAAAKEKETENVYGLYVIGSGETKPIIEQIHGSKYKDSMRIIQYQDLIDLIRLEETLEPAIGEKEAIRKTQNLLFPVESIDLGNVLRLILEISEARSSAEEEIEREKEVKGTESETDELPWAKQELSSYLEDCTPYQRILLGALAQVEEEPIPLKKLVYLMEQITSERPSEGIDKKITGYSIAGARAGLKMRRKHLKKEDIIDSERDDSVGELVYRIRREYKSTIVEWARKERLMAA